MNLCVVLQSDEVPFVIIFFTFLLKGAELPLSGIPRSLFVEESPFLVGITKL